MPTYERITLDRSFLRPVTFEGCEVAGASDDTYVYLLFRTKGGRLVLQEESDTREVYVFKNAEELVAHFDKDPNFGFTEGKKALLREAGIPFAVELESEY